MDLGWLLKGEFNKTSNRRYIQETALQFCWLEHKTKKAKNRTYDLESCAAVLFSVEAI